MPSMAYSQTVRSTRAAATTSFHVKSPASSTLRGMRQYAPQRYSSTGDDSAAQLTRGHAGTTATFTSDAGAAALRARRQIFASSGSRCALDGLVADVPKHASEIVLVEPAVASSAKAN